MREAIPLIFAVAFPALVLVFTGWRRHEPAWVVVGNVMGYLTLAAGIVWASGIGSSALWAAFLAALGVAIWAQTEVLWWRRRRDR